jgi:hypothetical protein
MKWLLKAGKRNFSYQVAWCNPLQLPKKILSGAAAPKVFIMILNLLDLAAELQSSFYCQWKTVMTLWVGEKNYLQLQKHMRWYLQHLENHQKTVSSHPKQVKSQEST